VSLEFGDEHRGTGKPLVKARDRVRNRHQYLVGPLDAHRNQSFCIKLLGVAMLPARVVRELVRMGELKTLTLSHSVASSLLRPLYLLQLRERPHSPLAREFCTLLTQVLERR